MFSIVETNLLFFSLIFNFIVSLLERKKVECFKIFFLVGVTIGTSATIFGIFLGVTFSIYIENFRQFLSTTFNISLFPEEIYFLSTMPSEINSLSIIIISTSSIIITIIVSIFPALKASKLDPIKALKYE